MTEAGFAVTEQSDTTKHVYRSAKRIAAIATLVLRPLAWLTLVPLLGGLVRPLGFASARRADLFVRACRAQLRVFDKRLGAYYVHVFVRA